MAGSRSRTLALRSSQIGKIAVVAKDKTRYQNIPSRYQIKIVLRETREKSLTAPLIDAVDTVFTGGHGINDPGQTIDSLP